jgi:predicted nucleic acid-binding protein
MGQELPSGPDKAQVDLQATVQRDIAAPKAAGDEYIARLQKLVKDLHLKNAGATIRLPDAAGVFPSAARSKFPVLVVDTNILRNDIIYSCRNSGRVTTLVNDANSGLLRLFCARHVVSEVKEHYREWCEVAGIAPEEFERRWIKAYAPLLRVVDQLPDGLLSEDEERRVEIQRVKDPDDIPSVTLALVLEAFYLSEDKVARQAVYGSRFTNEEIQKWVNVLKAGGDAGILGLLLEAVAMLTGLVGASVWGVFDKLTRNLKPWIRLLIAVAGVGAGGYFYRRLPEERRAGYRDRFIDVLEEAVAFGSEYVAATARFDWALPDVPDWSALAGERPPVAVLTRACLHTLARSKVSHCSAVELAETLPRLGVAQGAPKVREVLRSNPGAFEEVYRGRWQVGATLVRQPGGADGR